MKRRRADICNKLKLRIKALEVANTLKDLIALDPLAEWHSLDLNRAGTWGGNLSSNWRLVIRPHPTESTDITDATEATVTEIVDYH